MKRNIVIFLVACAVIFLAFYVNRNSTSRNVEKNISKKIPYYFIAVHCEPYHDLGRAQEDYIKDSYNYLLEKIAKADEYNIKLTLMFSASWADYITANPERIAELKSWKDSGHEIAAHHHGVYHPAWDGYSGYSEKDAMSIRKRKCKNPENYQGDFSDYMDRIKKINPSLNSGCLNEEISKKELPDEISYSTCSGFSNHLGVGIREDDSLGPEKGINKYVTTGYYHGIQRKWLTHYQTTNLDRIAKTKDVIKKMDVNEVYGAIVHAGKSEHEAFITFLEFIHQQDPAGEQSRTLTEVIKQKLLPEKSISTDLLDKEEDKNNNYLCKCGDEICDDFEQRNPLLCPKDCRQSDVQPSNSK